MTARLADGSLDQALPGVRRPAYDRAAVIPGIVHLGVGAFHRAHQAIYVDDCLAAGETDWGITGVSLRSPAIRDALRPQDGLYTHLERSEEREKVRIVGALRDVLVAPESPEEVVARLASPATRIVSLTITEKGYCIDAATGRLRDELPEIRADIADPERPQSAPGFILAGLRRRRAVGAPPFTVLSCDNLVGNGKVLRQVVLELARLTDPDLARYVEGEVAFPSTMVDRIVPATTDADRARARAATGLDDRHPVVSEPFAQWVVEDHFPSGRPQLESVGVEMATDVAPFELMKLRLVNGTHSLLAYCGLLSGCETISETVAEPIFAEAARRYMREVSGTFGHPPGIDVDAYQKTVLDRFANSAVRYTTAQVASDGSLKLSQRAVPPALALLESGAPTVWLPFLVAAWMRCAAGGSGAAPRDPIAEQLATIARRAQDDTDALVREYISIAAIFGSRLPQHTDFIAQVCSDLKTIGRDGARATVEAKLRRF